MIPEKIEKKLLEFSTLSYIVITGLVDSKIILALLFVLFIVIVGGRHVLLNTPIWVLISIILICVISIGTNKYKLAKERLE